ncbi:pseudaminic acid cytidylyltransferase [Moritella sp. Urea-trap-13]|uniref:pseudaminic acid cytidylyltransferase n=1 Tax=Moritella sp. Urea-trap-13 TaxID=2058327 RepID=UPI000C338A97|nr:pseudaminic acid cytidylyltransferase [Moritella sp. Urea-trap-13]PKH05284.1 pseudaminic acid cytidylyltransferase [Moritella sp. Urea-trap-13]
MKIAVIPARGGSKRIPGKNIKLFHGKPIIAYSIEAAIASACFDKVIVSTDDEDIADVALAYGAEVPFVRPADIADDHATTMEVIQHAIQWCESQQLPVDLLCCIYATAPFVLPSDLSAGLAVLSDDDIDYAFSATSFGFPIQRAIALRENGTVQMLQPEHLNTRSQDLEGAYHDAGQFYWGRVSAFKLGKPFFSASAKAVLLPRKRVQDIDNQEDWELAEALYAVMNHS